MESRHHGCEGFHWPCEKDREIWYGRTDRRDRIVKVKGSKMVEELSMKREWCRHFSPELKALTG